MSTLYNKKTGRKEEEEKGKKKDHAICKEICIEI